MKIKREFERRTYHANGGFEINGTFQSLESATENKDHNTQCTFEETEGKDYTHVCEYVDDGDGFEHHRDLYFITDDVLLECDNEPAGDE